MSAKITAPSSYLSRFIAILSIPDRPSLFLVFVTSVKFFSYWSLRK
nr:MAG TPA: hypothetical protein [Caudoviricetes sp.]